MAQQNAARFFKAIQQDQALKEKLQVADHPDAFIKLAAERGYQFNQEELQAELDKLSEEEVARIINPGAAPRHHLYPR